jgi:4-amino-4-deoxy-L-arabinose transferase-like glycosyltransferase
MLDKKRLPVVSKTLFQILLLATTAWTIDRLKSFWLLIVLASALAVSLLLWLPWSRIVPQLKLWLKAKRDDG